MAAFWPVILRELLGAGVDDLRVLRAFAEAHVDDDLRDLGHGHHVRVAELLAERGRDVLVVPIFQPAHLSTTPLHFTQNRTLRPSSSGLRPMRVGLPHSGHTSCTFDGVQRRLALDDAALDVLLRVRPRVALDEVHALDDQPALVRNHAQHAAALAAIAARRSTIDVVVLR